MKNIIFGIILFCAAICVWFVFSEIHSSVASEAAQVEFQVVSGESVAALGDRLEEEGVVRSAWFFTKYLSFKGVDTKIQQGTYVVEAPITLARVVDALQQPLVGERNITIIPGWSIHDIATYLEEEGVAPADHVYGLLGIPAEKGSGQWDAFVDVGALAAQKPRDVSYEGYIQPETRRFLEGDSPEKIVSAFVAGQDADFQAIVEASGGLNGRTAHEVLTMASILQREVRGLEDMKMVSDLFWRRFEIGWALQADSTVHYIFGGGESVFTTAAQRDSKNLWNTYEYPGLPPGPIGAPSREAIEAALNPTPNDYWYFLTTLEGEVKYAKTIEEHNSNRVEFLR